MRQDDNFPLDTAVFSAMIVVTDLTVQLMEKTYWSGYNRVYSPQLFSYSGQPAMVKKFGNWYRYCQVVGTSQSVFSYDKAPRALIFARDQGNVKDVNSMLALMRYNNFQEDPLSRCDCTPPYSAESTIAARSDLNSPNGKYPIKDQGFMDMGATDAKITSNQWIDSLRFLALAGPPGELDSLLELLVSRRIFPRSAGVPLGHFDSEGYCASLWTTFRVQVQSLPLQLGYAKL